MRQSCRKQHQKACGRIYFLGFLVECKKQLDETESFFRFQNVFFESAKIRQKNVRRGMFIVKDFINEIHVWPRVIT